MITITDAQTLQLTPPPHKQILPVLELPLQFGHVCPNCQTVIYGGAEVPDPNLEKVPFTNYAEPVKDALGMVRHSYPMSYDWKILTLINGVRGVLFWEEGHCVTGYDPFYSSPTDKVRCMFRWLFTQASLQRAAKAVFQTLDRQNYIYVNYNQKNQFLEKVEESPQVAISFLEQMEAAEVLKKIPDMLQKSPPIYLLRQGLNTQTANDILVKALANQPLVNTIQ